MARRPWVPVPPPPVGMIVTGEIVSVYIPIRLRSESNCRDHWTKKSKRRKGQREAVAMMLAPSIHHMPPLPVKVLLCRYGPRRMDPDGSIRSLKAVRDEVAKMIGVDDDDSEIDFDYDQRPSKEYGVEITIEPRRAA